MGTSFLCPACGKQFASRPDLVGRKVKCRCGNVFVVTEPKSAAPSTDTYDIADDDLAPPPPRAAPPPTFNLQPGQNLPPTADAQPMIDESRVLPYQARARPRPVADQELARSTGFMNFYLPIGLLIVGAGLRVAQIALPGMRQHGILIAIGAVLLGTVLNVLLMLGAVIVASKITDADFGPLDRAILKLAAMSVLGGGVASFFVALDWGSGYNGPIIAIHALIILYFIMFQMFFELDLLENLTTVVIVTAFQTAAFCIAFGRLKI